MAGRMMTIRTTAIAAARPMLNREYCSWYMRVAITSRLGLPPPMMYTMSNIFSTLMTIVVVTTVIVGRITGTVICQNVLQAFAPSTEAASSRSAGTFLIAADRIVIQNPVDIQIPTMISMTL